MRMYDSLVNLVSGLGTPRDKAAHAGYVMPTMSQSDMVAAYKSSSLIRRAVNLPAEDACREWREWQAEGADIDAIEAEEDRLNIQGKVLQARMMARLLGGAALLIGDGATDVSKPIVPKAMKKGGLRYVTLLNYNNLYAGPYDLDPASEHFGRPSHWVLNIAGNVAGIILHPTRVAVFHGVEPTNTGFEMQTGWGDSILPGMIDPLRRVDEVIGNTVSLVYEAKIDVIKIPDFMANLQKRGAAYSEEVIRRTTLAATAKGINGMLLLDAAEEYDQKTASFAGLPDILDRTMQLASAASGIPMTLLFGMSPAGMNATGEGDTRGYYDRVRVEQTLHMEPAMAVLDECIIMSALGNRPDDLHYNWRPLWQPTAKERAENGNNLMSALEKLNGMGTIQPEAIGKAAVNALTECGAFPGLEGYVDEMTESDGGDDSPDMATAVEPLEPKEAVTDAAPRTLYVNRKVLNGADIIAWAKGQGFKTTLPADDMHVTIAFSRKPIDWMTTGQSWTENLELPEGGARIVERFGEARVLLFNASELSWRHEEIKNAGATWDHPEYQPHITISYDPESPDVSEIEPYRGKIDLGPEIFAEVKEDWLSGVKEE